MSGFMDCSGRGGNGLPWSDDKKLPWYDRQKRSLVPFIHDLEAESVIASYLGLPRMVDHYHQRRGSPTATSFVITWYQTDSSLSQKCGPRKGNGDLKVGTLYDGGKDSVLMQESYAVSILSS